MLQPDLNIAFIGGGKMTSAMVEGLIKGGHPRKHIMVCAPSAKTRSKFVNTYHVRTERDNSKAVLFSDTIIISVKPALMNEVCDELDAECTALNYTPTIISVAAGISWNTLASNFSNSENMICAMPNLPSAIGSGLIGLFAHDVCALKDKVRAENIMTELGTVVWVQEEAQMSAIVAAAGSAPAYFFLFLEAMENEAIALGLPKHVANKTVLQSALGAITMAVKSSDSFETLRRKVTSPKGTTEHAVKSLKNNQLEKIVKQAMSAAANRTDELYEIY